MERILNSACTRKRSLNMYKKRRVCVGEVFDVQCEKKTSQRNVHDHHCYGDSVIRCCTQVNSKDPWMEYLVVNVVRNKYLYMS